MHTPWLAYIPVSSSLWQETLAAEVWISDVNMVPGKHVQGGCDNPKGTGKVSRDHPPPPAAHLRVGSTDAKGNKKRLEHVTEWTCCSRNSRNSFKMLDKLDFSQSILSNFCELFQCMWLLHRLLQGHLLPVPTSSLSCHLFLRFHKWKQAEERK